MSEDTKEQPGQGQDKDRVRSPGEIPEEKSSETRHSVNIDGEEIFYTATAGTIVLKEEIEEGKEDKDGPQPKASIFYVAYRKEGSEDPAGRPITFAFNGGPGSSSVWLHLGVLGPRRVEMDEMGNPPPPPYRLVENEFSLLDVTDLVFIDPVSTGYSRAVPGEKPTQFHEVTKDIESVGEFIRLYTTRNQRWASPKFLIGESYGTTRAAGLTGFLQERHGMYLNGTMLVSSVLDFQTLSFNPGNDLPYCLYLPTYTATAWYHGRLPEDLQTKTLQEVLVEASEFALGDYALALLQGTALPKESRVATAERLARLSGLRPAFVEQSNLRVGPNRFFKELLRDRRLTVGRLDSRFTGTDRDSAGENPDYDPSLALIMGPYTAMLNDYVRRDLEFESDLPYEILTSRVHPWSWEKYQNQYLNVSETLREAMVKNPHLKVFVGNGYYDLATPFLATEFTFNHLGLEEEQRANVSMGYYEAGHMMYIHRPSLGKLRADLTAFIQTSSRDAST